jgi:hypothetical protein
MVGGAGATGNRGRKVTLMALIKPRYGAPAVRRSQRRPEIVAAVRSAGPTSQFETTGSHPATEAKV